MFQIDPLSRTPVYEQLKSQVLRLASLGLLEENEQMPSVRQLASDLGINPNTVQKAYRELEREELIITVPGKGSFLAAPEVHREKIKEEIQSSMYVICEEAAVSGLEAEEVKELFSKTVAEAFEERRKEND